jgi:hypothetical protein
MNPRKPMFVVGNFKNTTISINGHNDIWVAPGVAKAAGKGILVATRPFPGAKPMILKYFPNDNNTGVDAGYSVNSTDSISTRIWMCPDKVYSILKISRKVNRFTLWIKK